MNGRHAAETPPYRTRLTGQLANEAPPSEQGGGVAIFAAFSRSFSFETSAVRLN